MYALHSILLLAGLLVPTAAAQRQSRVPTPETAIHYDRHGVPHVFGTTDEAAFFGLGYHHARDFPIGTLNMLWLHSGRMAEVAGPSYLDEDRLIRLWDVPRVADRHRVELAEVGYLALVEAYVAGVEAGRAWWRGDGSAADSARLDALLGDDLSVHVDPVPDYLNQAFSPFGDFDDPEVPLQMRAVVDRLFGIDHPVTVDHVLRLGACINSFFLLRNNPVELNALPTADPDLPLPLHPAPLERLGVLATTQATKASNGWMISPPGLTNGGIVTLSDSHVTVNKLHIRPYPAQVRGPGFQASGLTMPGYPAIYIGFNDAISWTFTAPVGDPVAHNRWQVTLEDSVDPEELVFEFQAGQLFERVFLEKVEETLSWFDPATGTDETLLDTRYYVPRSATESEELVFDRYPVIPETVAAPLPGDDVFFEQAAFAREGSPWETFFRLGFARNVTSDVDPILERAMVIFGNGNNLMLGDRAGLFRYVLMARLPIQGPDVPEAQYSEESVLTGDSLAWRWQGFHGVEELPQIGPADVTGGKEVWINNNVSPDLIETTRFDEGDLASYPAYMVPQESVSSWRQLRAAELLRNANVLANAIPSEIAARDVRNQWMHMLWPFYVEAANLVPGGVSNDVLRLIEWLEEYRAHDENDQPRPTHDFEAHHFSQVTVYAVLLRSYYLDELGDDQPTQLPDDQLEFGHDPLHPLFDDPSQFTYANYGANIDAMARALETVAMLWRQGDGVLGLVNQSLLATFSNALPGDPWGDPRYATAIEPHWEDEISGTYMTRWGHVNMGCLTPHYLPPPKRGFIEGVGFRGGDAFEFLRGHVYSAFVPPLLANLPYDLLQVPFYTAQLPRVNPLRGVKTSLYLTQHLPIFLEPAPRDYQESEYAWTPSDSFAWHPQTQGSQVLLSTHLFPNRPAQAAFLALHGGTEITRPDLLGDGELAYQRRFGPSLDFAQARWRRLETRRSKLGKPKHLIRIEPYVVLPD